MRLARILLAGLLALTASGCAAGTGETSLAHAARAAISQAITPAIVSSRGLVQDIAPAPRKDVTSISHADALATRLIVRWEVTSEAVYTRRYQGVIWPGGASGPTWCIGYDGGHQTVQQILFDWAGHPQREQLATTSGVTGQEARTRLPEWRAVRSPFPLCAEVFTRASLPQYTAATRRAVGKNFDQLSPGAQAALADLGYNRGWQLAGKRRAGMRTIAKVCVPALDEVCIARELRGMCPLWQNTPNGPGLCARREQEAQYVEGRHG